MKNSYKIFIFFAAVGLFAGNARAISFGDIKPGVDNSVVNTSPMPIINSPGTACQAYQTDPRYINVWNKFLVNNEGECQIQIGDGNTGYGIVDFYFSNGNFCVKSTGDYFSSAGAGGTNCAPSSLAKKNTELAPVKKLPTASPAKKTDNKAAEQLQSLVDKVNEIMKWVMSGLKNILDWANYNLQKLF